MKIVVYVGAVIIVLLALGLIFLEPAPDVAKETLSEAKVAAPLLLQPLAPAVSITDSSTTWKEIESETEVVNGDGIKTSVVGRAIVTQGSDIVTSIDSNSELVVEVGQDNKGTILNLAAGQTWTKINRALEQDEFYEVHTPTLVAAVRGTSFGVSTNPASQITVTEGTVWASLIDETTGEIDPTTTVEVPAGKIVIYIDGKLEVREIEDKDKGDWYYEHNPEDNKDSVATTTEEEVADTDLEEEETDGVVTEEPPVVPPPLPVPKVVKVTSLSPEVLDKNVPGGRLVIRGDFLSEVDEINIDDRMVDFTLTTTNALMIEAAELPDKEAVYDITLYYDGKELLLPKAFSIVNSKPVLKIDSAAAGQTESPEDFIELKGTGFAKVKTVLVNGQSNEFVSINDQLMHIFDYTFSRAKTIKLITPDSEVTYTNP